MGCLFMLLLTLAFSIAGLFGWSEYKNRDIPIPCDATLEEMTEIAIENWRRTSLWDRLYIEGIKDGNGDADIAFLERVECEE